MDFLYGRNQPFLINFISLANNDLCKFLRFVLLTNFTLHKKSPNVIQSWRSNPL